MGKKKNKNQGEKNNDEPEQQQPQKKADINGDGGEKAEGGQPLVLKIDYHCVGCATKTRKAIRAFEGVESVKGGDGNKLMITGKVDPLKLREMIEQKAKGKVEFLSPLPKKDKENGKKEKGDGGGGEKKAGDKQEKKADDKKSRELPVTTAVMKLDLHCDGCVQKIRRTVTKTKGYQEMSIDAQKNLLTVKGTMDAKALAESLKEKLKRAVEIVPPKKDGGEKKEKGGGGGGEKGKGGEKAETTVGDQAGAEWENRIQFVQYAYPDPYTHGYMMGYPVGQSQFNASQMFSDENPNACSVM